MVTGPLHRSRGDKKIAGVCGGLAKYIGMDPTLLRIIMACLAFWGIGIVFYIVCWIAMPLEPLALPPASTAQPVPAARA